MRIQADTSLRELLGSCPEICDGLLDLGLECPGCMGAEFETVSEACRAHGLEVRVVIEKLQRVIDESCRNPQKEL